MSFPTGAGTSPVAVVVGDFNDLNVLVAGVSDARELEIEGSMPRVVRMLAHVETHLGRADAAAERTMAAESWPVTAPGVERTSIVPCSPSEVVARVRAVEGSRAA